MKKITTICFLLAQILTAQISNEEFNGVSLDSISNSTTISALNIVNTYFASQTDGIEAFSINSSKAVHYHDAVSNFHTYSFPILTGLKDDAWKNFLIIIDSNQQMSHYLMHVKSESYPEWSANISEVSLKFIDTNKEAVHRLAQPNFDWTMQKNITEYSSKNLIPINFTLNNSNSIMVYFSIPSVEVSAKTQRFFNSLDPDLRKFINEKEN